MEDRLQMYNTLTRSIERFVPNVPGKVAMYTCGPTVYHFAHIGNLRSYIQEDVLEKTLRYLGYDVKRVMNITDVGHLSDDGDNGEDKMVKGAQREHKTVMEIAKFYTDAFFEDCRKLNIKTPDVVEPATGCIPEFIHMIEVLLEKGYAYQAGENVYFDTSKLREYYVLTNHSEDSLLEGVRDDVDVDPNKRNKNDFVLWFTTCQLEYVEYCTSCWRELFYFQAHQLCDRDSPRKDTTQREFHRVCHLYCLFPHYHGRPYRPSRKVPSAIAPASPVQL